MASEEYIAVNKANWDERAPHHAGAPAYSVERLVANPTAISDVVAYDQPLLGDITGQRVVHLQCHIGTDTISLARRGAGEVVGLDFSPASLAEARRLAARAAGGEKLSFMESTVYDAPRVLGKANFDLVFTGIGALCWLPDIRAWAHTVATLLKPGGRLFIREGHPMLSTIDETVPTHLEVRFPYFENPEPMVFESDATYIPLPAGTGPMKTTRVLEWNHGLGEIVQAVLDAGMVVTRLAEHRSLPWEALPGRMKELENGEWVLREKQDLLPLSYTLQAVKG